MIEGQRGDIDSSGFSRPRTQKLCFQCYFEGEVVFHTRKWYNLWELRVKCIRTRTFAVTPLSHRPVKKTKNRKNPRK